MKRTGRCVKCGGSSIYHSDEIMDRGDGNEALRLAIRRTGSINAHDVGLFEVYACRACGYCELYVVDPGDLDADEGSADDEEQEIDP